MILFSQAHAAISTRLRRVSVVELVATHHRVVGPLDRLSAGSEVISADETSAVVRGRLTRDATARPVRLEDLVLAYMTRAAEGEQR